jgi:integrase
MAKKLTDFSLRHLKAGSKRREVPDGGCTGLYLVVQPSGVKSWAVRYRYGGKPRKLTLGSLPGLTLSEARVKAAAALAEVHRGTDPIQTAQAAKRLAKQQAIAQSGNSVERLAGLYLEHAQQKMRPNSFSAVERTFRNEALPRWRGRLAGDIGKADVKELLRDIHRTRPIASNRTQAILSGFFSWLVNEDYLLGSPMVGIKRLAQENVRERCLSDDEIRRFWAATEMLPAAYRDIYRLLLLSAARRQEVAEMRWAELDVANKVWTLPAARSKTKVPHLLPLGQTAWDIIAAQPRQSDYVWGRARRGFSVIKPILDEHMHKLKQERGCDRSIPPDEGWVTHDLRRTARSLLSRGHVPSDVAELMLGHLLPGMRRRYDRHLFHHEKAEGFAALEREIDLILHPLAADVVPFRR